MSRFTLKHLKLSKGPRPYVIYKDGKAHDNHPNKRDAERALKRFRKENKRKQLTFLKNDR